MVSSTSTTATLTQRRGLKPKRKLWQGYQETWPRPVNFPPDGFPPGKTKPGVFSWGKEEMKRCDTGGMYRSLMSVSFVLDLHLCLLPLLRIHVGFFQHGGQKPTSSQSEFLIAGWTRPGTRSELAATIGRTRLMATLPSCHATWPLWGSTVATRHHGNLEMDSK